MQILIRAYKYFISPLLGYNCRFHPTCSHYAAESFKKHGPLKGLLLSISRLIRCNPWHNAKMTDPVPERFDWRVLFGYKRP